jgi:hypothetical protein
MRREPLDARVVQIVLLTVVTWTAGCEFEPSDIPLDDLREGGVSRKRERDAESGPPDPPDTGAAGRRSPTRGGAGEEDAPLSGGAGDPGVLDEPVDTPGLLPDATANMDSGSDASPWPDAQMDATSNDGDLVDEDADHDEDAGDTDDPCQDGTFRCVSGRFTVIADFTTTLNNATVTATCAGHTFEAVRDGLVHELLLPIGCPMWVRATADGYWDSETPYFFGPEVGAFEWEIRVFTTALINFIINPTQQVQTKGLVTVNVAPPIPGAGISIGQPSDPPYVTDSVGPVQGNALIAGGSDLIAFANVEPGPLTLMPFAPEGVTCVPIPVEYEAKPMTTTFLPLYCVAAGP